MEKDFKKEYNEHIKSEAPDLWARIESGLTEKAPSSKIRKFQARKWKKVMPAAAAVLVLLVAAPIFAPRVMEKASDMAMFDAKAENMELDFGYAMDECIVEEGMVVEDMAEAERAPESFYGTPETKPETTVEMPTENAGGMTGGTNSTTSHATSEDASDTGNTGSSVHTEKKDVHDKEADKVQSGSDADGMNLVKISMIHFQVLEKTQDMNLLAIDKEHIGPVCDLYLIVVDGEEKVLAVPPTEEEVAFEPGIWYDLTVTDSTEYGIDYIFAK